MPLVKVKMKCLATYTAEIDVPEYELDDIDEYVMQNIDQLDVQDLQFYDDIDDCVVSYEIVE